MKKNNFYFLISNILFFASICITFIGIFFNYVHLPIIYSISIRINLILYFCWMLIFFIHTILKHKKMIYKTDEFKTLVMVALSVIVIAISTFYGAEKKYFSAAYFNKALMSLSFVFQIAICTHLFLFQSFKKIICFFSMFFILFIFILFIFIYKNTPRASYLGTSNPNEAAVYLAAFSAFSIMGFRLFQNKFIIILSVLTFILGCFLIYLTGSRNSLISIGLCLGLLIVFTFIEFKKINFMNVIIVLLPLIVMMIYMIVAYKNIDSSVMNIYSNKSIATRKAIWTVGLKLFVKSPVFGNYFNIVVTFPLEQDLPIYTVTQFHSTAVDSLASYGFIFYLIQSILLVRFLNSKFYIITDKNNYLQKSKIPLAFSYLFIFIGLFEGGIYLSMYCFISTVLVAIAGETIFSKKMKRTIICYYYKETNNFYVSIEYTNYCFSGCKINKSNAIMLRLILFYCFCWSVFLRTNMKTNQTFKLYKNRAQCELIDENELINAIDHANIDEWYYELTI